MFRFDIAGIDLSLSWQRARSLEYFPFSKLLKFFRYWHLNCMLANGTKRFFQTSMVCFSVSQSSTQTSILWIFSHSDRFIKFCATVWIGQRSKFECHQNEFLYLFTTANAYSRAKRGTARTDILLVSLVLLHQWLADMIWWHKSLSQSQRTLIQTKLANEVLDCLRFMQFSYICIFMYFFFLV